MESGRNASGAVPAVGMKEVGLGGLAGDEAEAVLVENWIGADEVFGGEAGGGAEEGVHDFEENLGAEAVGEWRGGDLEIGDEPE